MGLYKVKNGPDTNTNATDLNQFVDALTGKNDIGTIQLFQPINPPGALTATVNATIGNLSGVYQYKVAFITGYWQGLENVGTMYQQGNTGGGVASNTVSPSGQQINLSSIPIGPAGTVARIIYRTKANGSIFYLLQQINDNTTTSWTDNISDANLGAIMPTNNTTGTSVNVGGTIIDKDGTVVTSGPINVGSGGPIIRNTNKSISLETSNGYAFLSGLTGVEMAQNCWYDGSNWYRYDTTQPANLLYIDKVSLKPTFKSAPAGTGPITFDVGSPLAQILSGGHKIQSGFGGSQPAANTLGIYTITFPVPFNSVPEITLGLDATNPQHYGISAVNRKTTGFDLTIFWNGNASQFAGVMWNAKGT